MQKLSKLLKMLHQQDKVISIHDIYQRIPPDPATPSDVTAILKRGNLLCITDIYSAFPHLSINPLSTSVAIWQQHHKNVKFLV